MKTWRDIRSIGAGLRVLGFSLLLAGVLVPSSVRAWDLEPRFLSPAPVGMNFAIVAYSHSVGNVLLDRALPLEGTEARLNAISVAYARSINVFGLAGRVSAAVPIARGTWTGEVQGTDSSTTREGFGDPMVIFAVDFVGAPALRGVAFAGYHRKTIAGASLRVSIPVGQYDSSKFFNLGSGRWGLGLRLGAVRYAGSFVLEGYLSAGFFATNRNFYGGNTLAQQPMVAFQVHTTYRFRRGWWAAVSFGQSFGGKTEVNGIEKDNSQTNNRLGATLAVPITAAHSLKLVFTSGISTRAGADFNTVVLAWQYRWGGR